jgi:uncharacterized protein (DUF983 family)
MRRFAQYMKRACRLTCPECGRSPIFKPLRQVRGITDWLRPLDGCPRCRYRYEREEGYFLLAIWVINYGIVGGLAVFLALTLDALVGLTLRQQILYVVLPMPFLSFLLARHAKALFLAIDHFVDPQCRVDNNDEGHGGRRRPAPRRGPPTPTRRPVRRRARRPVVR